jgi:hypothetical protein
VIKAEELCIRSFGCHTAAPAAAALPISLRVWGIKIGAWSREAWQGLNQMAVSKMERFRKGLLSI